MKKIKIGQIGIGHNHGEEKMRAIRKYSDIFEVVGFAENNPDWIKKRGNLGVYKGLKLMSEEELLLMNDLDAILVETDVWDLVPTAQKCIDRGFHIHMDKPAGEDITAYEKLLNRAKEKELTIQLGYMYRYNPAIQKSLAAVKNNTLGEIFGIDTAMCTCHSADFRKWLRNFKGGTMYIFGCHLIDLIILFMGEPNHIIPFQKKTMLDGVDSYDNCFAVLEYPGCTATVRINSTEVNGFGRRHFVLCGEKGSIEIKPFERPTTMTLSLKDFADPYEYSGMNVNVADAEKDGRYDKQLLDFAGMVRGQMKNPFTYEHELIVQKATLRACGFDV